MYLYKFLAQKKKNTIYNNYKDTVCLNLLAFSTFINDSDDPSVLPYFPKQRNYYFSYFFHIAFLTIK